MADLHVIGALRNKRAELSGTLRQLEQQLAGHRANLAHLDGAGVTKANLLTRAGALEQVKALQAAAPGRFTWFNSYDVTKADAEQVLTQSVKDGAQGFGEMKFHVAVDGPELRRIYALAADLCVPLLIHFQEVDHFPNEGTWSAGFAKTFALENPRARVRFTEVNRNLPATEVATLVCVELQSTQPFVEACYPDSETRLVPELRLSSTDTLEPIVGQALDSDDVLVVSGGAQGIGAECALALAQRYSVRLALIGSTVRGANTSRAESLENNLRRFAAANVVHRYYACDLTDATAVKEVATRIAKELGSVTAVLHAAGVNKLRRIEALTLEDFAAVLLPKVAGLMHLVAAFDPAQLKLLMAFSSVIAKSGMAGNADYAYANEWLNLYLRHLQSLNPMLRCLSYNFSVWGEVGMGVKSVDHLARLGVEAIPLAAGVRQTIELMQREWPNTDLVVASRLSGLSTLRFAREPLPAQRFLTKVLVHQPEVDFAAEAFLEPKLDLYLEHHNYQGSLLFPAVLGIEAMAQSAYACVGKSPQSVGLVMENLTFNKPVVVPRDGRAIRMIARVVERGRAVGIVEQLDDPGTELAVDERGEIALGLVEILLETRAQLREHVADERHRLEALEQRVAQLLRLPERLRIAVGDPAREAAHRVRDQRPQRMLRVVRRVPQLRGRVVARRLDDLPLHDLAPQEERHETLPFGAERARRALEPPLQLRARSWSLRQVREG